MSSLTRLASRSLLILRGSDTLPLLQGLLTNDIRQLSAEKGLAAFLLNVKGRIVEDLLLWKRNEDLLLECSTENRKGLKSTLEKYRMRKKVEIVESDEPVCFSTNEGWMDPRIPEFGYRVYGETGNEDTNNYYERRVRFGICEGNEELGGMLPFQANGDFLNYISLDKGCYIGQELTARTAHTGVIRRRVVPFTCDLKMTSSLEKENIFDAKNKKVGQVVSRNSSCGLALLPLKVVDDSLFLDGQPLKAHKPLWMTA